MIFNFPFYPYHHSRYYANNKYTPFTKYNNQNYYIKNKQPNKNSVSDIKNQSIHKKNNSDAYHLNNSNTTDEHILDLFGLKLYYDDILLLCLIFFLYTEGIKDESLFIILILLLLS